MQQIGATAAGSQRYEQGKGVRVGIIDTGVDGSTRTSPGTSTRR
jgi:lantibiotic leader peptide-processing serine protease